MQSKKTYRLEGVETLTSVLSKETIHNIKTLEKHIFAAANSEKTYRLILYQIVGDILINVDISTIMANLKRKNTGWNHPVYNSNINKIREQDEFVENPFEVEEGVLECRCGSKRVFSYTKQVRSSDEPMTTFALCMSCQSRWTYSG